MEARNASRAGSLRFLTVWSSMSAMVLSVLFLASAGCGDDEDDGGTTPPAGDVYQDIIDEFALSPLPAIPYPANNLFNAERISLGKLLFFDPILGGESAPWIKSEMGVDPYRYRANDMACATCHFPSFAFADGRRLGAGVGGAQFDDMDIGPTRVVPAPSTITGADLGRVPRNTPTVLNTAFNGSESIHPTAKSTQFMDGRVTGGLEEQAVLPITSRDEMAGDAYGRELTGETVAAEVIQDSVMARIRAIPEYVDRFRQAFASEIRTAEDIELEHLGRAIAAYERELITPNSRYDQFVAGDRSVFSETEAEGFELFFGKGLCGDCHSGPMLSDYTFRIQGVGDDYDSILPGFEGKNGEGGDWGRFHADPEAFADQKFSFRTLTVRNVELTAPFFHSGSAGTLHEAVEFYNRGGLGQNDISTADLTAAGVVRDPSIRPLGLTEHEIDAIVAFMKTTTAPVQQGPLGIDLTTVPYRVPSGLLPPGMPTPAGRGPFLMDGSDGATLH